MQTNKEDLSLLLLSLEGIKELRDELRIDIKELREGGNLSTAKLIRIEEKMERVEYQLGALEKKEALKAKKDIEEAARKGGEKVKWGILALIGTGLVGLLLKLGFELLTKGVA